MANSILNGNRQFHAAPATRHAAPATPAVREGVFKRLGKFLGVVPENVAPRTVNRRDLYQASTSYDRRVVGNLGKVVSGRTTPTSAPKNQMDPHFLDFCAGICNGSIKIS